MLLTRARAVFQRFKDLMSLPLPFHGFSAAFRVNPNSCHQWPSCIPIVSHFSLSWCYYSPHPSNNSTFYLHELCTVPTMFCHGMSYWDQTWIFFFPSWKRPWQVTLIISRKIMHWLWCSPEPSRASVDSYKTCPGESEVVARKYAALLIVQERIGKNNLFPRLTKAAWAWVV